MNFLINLKYNIFKFSPYIAALGTTLIWMDEFSDFHVIGQAVVEYPVLAHVPFSLLLVALMAWAVYSTSKQLEKSRAHEHYLAWPDTTPPGNLISWQKFLNEAAYTQIFLIVISTVITLICVAIKISDYPVFSDNNFFNFLMLLEAYFAVLAFYFYFQIVRIGSVLEKFWSSGR